MRTTLSLDEDVARLLAKERQRSGFSFKQVVNHFLRLGLTAAKHPVRKPFVVVPRRLGLVNYDNIEHILEALEGPAHR